MIAQNEEGMQIMTAQAEHRLEEITQQTQDYLAQKTEETVSKIQAFVDKLNSMDEGTKQNIIRIAALVAAIGPLLIIIGTTISTVGKAMQGFVTLSKGIGNLKIAISGAHGVLGKLGAALGGISAPVLAVVAVVAVLAAAFVNLWKNNEE